MAKEWPSSSCNFRVSVIDVHTVSSFRNDVFVRPATRCNHSESVSLSEMRKIKKPVKHNCLSKSSARKLREQKWCIPITSSNKQKELMRDSKHVYGFLTCGNTCNCQPVSARPGIQNKLDVYHNMAHDHVPLHHSEALSPMATCTTPTTRRAHAGLKRPPTPLPRHYHPRMPRYSPYPPHRPIGKRLFLHWHPPSHSHWGSHWH